MSIELLKSVDQAEQRAEEIRQNALMTARELIQNAEEKCAQDERDAVLEHRALLARELEQAREAADAEIRTAKEKNAAVRVACQNKARENLARAAEYILERIIADGDH